MLEDFQRYTLQNFSKSTAEKDLIFIMRLLRNNKIYIPKPKAKAGKVTEVREFKDDELRRFFETCEKWYPEYLCLFLTMLATGMRLAELVPSNRSTHRPLLKSEVDFDKGIITVRSAKVLPNQEGKMRFIPVTNDLLELLKHQINLNSDGEYVFNRFTYKNCRKPIARIFDSIIKRAGIPKFDELKRKLISHSFRHTYATKMAEKIGGDQFILKEVLGHKRIVTTERYVHIKPTTMIIDVSDFYKNPLEDSLEKKGKDNQAVS